MTNKTKTTRARKTSTPVYPPAVQRARTAAKAMIAIAQQYVVSDVASALVLSDVENYDAPAVIKSAEHGHEFAIWILHGTGSQLIRPAGTDLGKTCRMTLESFRGNAMQIWTVDSGELRQLALVGPETSRAALEEIGRACDLLIQAAGYDHARIENTVLSARYAAEIASGQNDSDGYWSTRRDEHANVATYCASRAFDCQTDARDALAAAGRM